jgi:hypothetical protein
VRSVVKIFLAIDVQKTLGRFVLALIPQPLLPQGEGEKSVDLAFQVPRPEGEGFRVRATIRFQNVF